MGIWEQVQANRRTLDGCPRHLFEEAEVRIGQKLTCKCCAGQMTLTDIGNYIKGYEAAGKDATDIWPAWTTTRVNDGVE